MTCADPKTVTVTRDAAGAAPSAAPDHTSAAERQRAYRQRRKRDEIDAIGYETDASRVTLLNMLRQELATLEAATTTVTRMKISRSSAQRILKVIVTRYGIEL